MKKNRFYLPLNLQHFADGDDQDATDTADTSEETETTDKTADQKIPYDRFKKKVDEANELKRKLAEIEQARDDAERKKLEEQNEFKALYEQTQQELETIRGEAQATKLDALKTELLVQAGYTGEQLDRVKKYVVGGDEDALKASVEDVKNDIPPKVVGADPSAGNTTKTTPQPKGVEEEAKSFYQKLKESGRLRR